jgi:iron complex outermembrane receptor protein
MRSSINGAGFVPAPSTPLIRRAVLLALLAAGAAHAGDATDPDADARPPASKDKALALDTVNVTAEKHTANIQQTPIAIGAIDAGQLQEREVHTVRDLAGQVAGLTLPSNYQNQQYVFIRGIGSSRPAGNPSVGIYLDDVYLPRQFANGFLNLPDIDQVEVLRGPQGTLYGQNTSSGAIKVITRQPTNDTVGTATVQAGNLGAVESQLYLAGALKPDVLTASIALSRRRNDGYTDDETLHRQVNNFDTTQGRAKFLLTPNQDLSILLTVDQAIDHSANTIPSPTAVGGDPGFYLGKNKTLAPNDGRTNLRTGGISLVATQKLDENLALKSVTAARNIKDTQPWDYTGLATPYYIFNQDIRQRQFSQEFQFLGQYDRWNFVSGVSFMREHFGIDRITDLANRWSIQQGNSTANTLGVFGQAHYDVTDKLGLTAGVRLSREQHFLQAAAYGSDANRDYVRQSFGIDGLSVTNKAATPKFTVDYAFTPSLYSYATWAKGETSGGWNPAPSTLAIARVAVKPEKVTSYEMGLKASFWDNRATANAAVFYNKYDDFQTNLTNPVINGEVIAGSVLTNAARAHTEGAELEASFKLSRAFLLKFNAAYLDTRVDQYLSGNTLTAVDYTGNKLPYAPRLSYSTTGIYDWQLPHGNLRFNGTVRYATHYYTGVEDQYRSPSQAYVDAGIFYNNDSGHWTFSLTGKNLTNRSYATPYYTSAVVSSAQFNTQREWLAGVRYDLF